MDLQENYNDEVAYEDEQQEMFEHYRFDIAAGQEPMRVDKYLATHMEYTSRHRIQLAIKAEYIRVNDKIVKANYVVRPGDVVTFVMPYQRRGLEILPEEIPLNIVHEDEDVLVLNKEPGMVVHPGHGHFSGSTPCLSVLVLKGSTSIPFPLRGTSFFPSLTSGRASATAQSSMFPPLPASVTSCMKRLIWTAQTSGRRSFTSRSHPFVPRLSF